MSSRWCAPAVCRHVLPTGRLRPSPASRTAALLGVAAATIMAGCATPSAPPAAPPVRTSAAVAADVAWLDRLTFGATTTDLRALQAEGRARWLNAQLHPGPIAPLPPAAQAQIDTMTISRTPMAEVVRSAEAQRKAADAVPDEEARAAARQAYQQSLNGLSKEAAQRMLLRALYSPQQLREQMTWFWFNHFNVQAGKAQLRADVGDYEDQLRLHALGRFRDILQASVFHPAMLLYLDNAQNAAGKPNENYARELMELHTLGVNGGYSQHDIQELARVLSGLGVRLADEPPRLKPALQVYEWHSGVVEFNPQRHDFGDKLFLGQAVHGGGVPEIEQVLDRLARAPATAHFVSRQIAEYFVADEPPPALVDRMAQRFLQTDGQIAEVLKTMIDSPEFNASLGHKFKDPVHFVVSAVRLAYNNNADEKPVLNTQPMINWLNRLGEAPYAHATPDGYPLDEAAWAGAGQMNTRFEIARQVGAGAAGLFKSEASVPVERPAFPQLANPLYYEGMAPRLAAATKQTLDQATSPQEWNALLLSSPEFMRR